MSEEDRKGPSKEEQFWLDVGVIAVLALPIVLGSRAPTSCFSPIHASAFE
jgi:hypothetical protein